MEGGGSWGRVVFGWVPLPINNSTPDKHEKHPEVQPGKC